MKFNINNIGLVLCVFLLTSCVYTKFEVYKSFENIETDTRYYKVEEKDIESDTVYLEFNDNKRYKFYYNFEEK